MATRTFYVGDLCYVLTRDEWDTVCLYDFDPDDNEGFLEPEKFSWTDYQAARPFEMMRTACGDGCYEGSDGKSYCVDSGSIGRIAVDCISDKAKLAETLEKGLGHLHEFDEEDGCGDEDGLLWFGSLDIQTA